MKNTVHEVCFHLKSWKLQPLPPGGKFSTWRKLLVQKFSKRIWQVKETRSLRARIVWFFLYTAFRTGKSPQCSERARPSWESTHSGRRELRSGYLIDIGKLYKAKKMLWEQAVLLFAQHFDYTSYPWIVPKEPLNSLNVTWLIVCYLYFQPQKWKKTLPQRQQFYQIYKKFHGASNPRILNCLTDWEGGAASLFCGSGKTLITSPRPPAPWSNKRKKVLF